MMADPLLLICSSAYLLFLVILNNPHPPVICVTFLVKQVRLRGEELLWKQSGCLHVMNNEDKTQACLLGTI